MTESFIPLSVPSFTGNELKYVSECITTGWVSFAGSFVGRFESMTTDFTGAKEAVACQSGTAALHLSLILAGVHKDDEVLVPTLTFIAPVNTIHYVGAHPVFMDCDAYLNIDPVKVHAFCENECQLEDNHLFNKKTGRRVRAIMVVHLFGHPVNMDEIFPIAQKYNLKIIEDATEALGSKYTTGAFAGKSVGTVGDFGCFSYNGNKIITTGGGGMIVTDNKILANKARYLSTQAKDDEDKFIHNEVGYNYRMTNLQAALGCGQMEHLPDIIQTKRTHLKKYTEKLSGIPGVKFITEPTYSFSNYWHLTLRIDAKEYGLSALKLKEVLAEHKIQARMIWELCHKQKPYAACEAFQISNALKQQEQCLNIPCSASLTDMELARVAEVIKNKS